MKKLCLFLFCFLLLSAGFAVGVKTLEVSFTIDKSDNVNIGRFFALEGRETWCGNGGDYSLQVLDENSNLLNSRNFSVDFILFSDPPRLLNETIVDCDMLFDMSKTSFFAIKHGDKTIYSENVAGKFCNSDNACNNYENIVSCPADCTAASEDGYCVKKADGVCDPDCAYVHDSDCPASKRCVGSVCFRYLNETLSSKPSVSQDYRQLVTCGVALLVFFLLVGIIAFLRRANRKADELMELGEKPREKR